MNDAKAAIKYKLNIKKYLEELAILCLEKPSEKFLVSLDMTEEIRRVALNRHDLPKKNFRIDFSERRGARFRNYVEKLGHADKASIYIWTERSNSCGLYEVSSLNKINFDFPGDVNKEGIFLLLASDSSNGLLFDFSRRDDSSGYDLELEAVGPNWSGIDY